MAEMGKAGMGGESGLTHWGYGDGSRGVGIGLFLHLNIFVIFIMNPMTPKPIAPFWSVGCVQFPAG